MRVALVALAVVLAGCPAASSPSTPTEDVTPATVPEVKTYPPGVTESGVTEADLLAETHTKFVKNSSYTLVSNRTIRYGNGSLVSVLSIRLRLAADREFLVRAETGGPRGPLFLGTPPASGRYWSNGTVYISALTRDGETTYTQFTPPNEFIGSWRYWRSTVPFGGQDGHATETFRGVFRDIPTDIVDNRTVNGTQVYRLVGDSARSRSFAKVGSGPVRNVTLFALVDENGVVRRMDLSYNTTLSGAPVHVDWTVRYLNVGNTTVDRPSWYDRAV